MWIPREDLLLDQSSDSRLDAGPFSGAIVLLPVNTCRNGTQARPPRATVGLVVANAVVQRPRRERHDGSKDAGPPSGRACGSTPP